MIGVYFLLQKEAVVYVGQSIDIKSRIKAHKKDKSKIFDDFMYIECKKELLKTSEEAFILKHNPIFNIKRAEITIEKKKTKKKTKKHNMKMFQVTDDVHRDAKELAKKRGMTLQGLMKNLIMNEVSND